MPDKTDHELEELLDLPLFRSCDEHELQVVRSHTTRIGIPTGSELCRRGVLTTEAFVVLGGEAAVTIDGTRVAVIGRGSMVGDLALLDGSQSLVTVTALSDMDVLVMSRREFHTVIDEAPVVARAILGTLPQRLRELANEQALGLVIDLREPSPLPSHAPAHAAAC